MNRCPVTYETLTGEETHYSRTGLHRIARGLARLEPLPYDSEALLREAMDRAPRMSIQGVQPKLSAVLRIKQGRFDVVDTGGRYIIKPAHPLYKELPENEDLTMHLAALAGLEVPFHTLLYLRDGSLAYCVRRFDRRGHSERVHVEDFAQLAGRSRETKYDSSMEKVASLVDRFCSFPVLEKERLFRMTLFAYLTGNEDMHLKNFSVIIQDGVVRLSPVYDQLSTTLVIKDAAQMALPLNGKKRSLTRADLLRYFPLERLRLRPVIVRRIVESMRNALPAMHDWIARSFLSEESRLLYAALLNERAAILTLD